MSDLISIREAQKRGIAKLRLDNWAHPDDHIELLFFVPGMLGPWVNLWSRDNSIVGEPNPQKLLITTIGDLTDPCWRPYVEEDIMSEKKRCGICSGSRVITLPVHQEATIAEVAGVVPRSMLSKTFPCPECAPVTSDARVAIVGSRASVTKEAKEVYPQEVMERQVVDQMAAHLHEAGLVQFRWSDPETNQDVCHLTGTLGVVAPLVVATMEQRIADRQELVARKLAEGVMQRVNWWGSNHGSDHVPKSVVASDFRVVLDRLIGENQPR